ncbi:L-seryl-tRNA(Sec) kinase-like [Silurus meridionalis]|nr:L-seryl-tRNA(Sec) kinase-like [Silurus meridionalis]
MGYISRRMLRMETPGRRKRGRPRRRFMDVVREDMQVVGVKVAEAGWKQYRQAVLECVEVFLQELNADMPHTHTGGGEVGTGSVCVRFKEAMKKQQILPTLQDTYSRAQRLVLLLDDNFYYQSMRYRVYQLARRHDFVPLSYSPVLFVLCPGGSVGFCEVYLHCPLEVCLHRNRTGDAPGDFFSNRISYRQRCACSVLHQVDQVCRRLVSQVMLTARGCRLSAEKMKMLARDLSEEKSGFLQELRAQVLQLLAQDECVCVERVVTMATDTFTRRTHVTMERHGVHS